ncbi:Intu_longin_1 domain-containing protein [Psidium guajava]|nr:Intu_longin_1 domain-containing protein [Psidium guajava]
MAENGHVGLEKQRLFPQDHEEKHFMSSEVLRDIIIGVSDGLTVPFALAAGLSGAQVNSGIILIAGIAEVVAGAICMGLGGYLAAKSEADHYARERKREQRRDRRCPYHRPLKSQRYSHSTVWSPMNTSPCSECFEEESPSMARFHDKVIS